jgi:hypothetical protein
MTIRGLAVFFSLILTGPAVAARPELSVAAGGPGKPHELTIQGSSPGMRLELLDGVQPIGVVVVDRSGAGRLGIGSLPSGQHTVRAVEWGTGKTVIEAFHFTLPSRAVDGFAPGASQVTGTRPVVMTSADLEGQGFPSVILGGAGGVSVVRNNRGVFGTPVKLPGIPEPTAIVAQDLNGDGLTDLAITSADGRVAILLNRGRGEFAPAQYATAGVHPSAIVSADFNGDGVSDLAIANRDGNDVSILIGNGDGSFRKVAAIPAGYSPRSLVVADFNGDGLPDIAASDFAGNNVSILLGNGDGGFHSGGDFASGSGPMSLVTADFDEDGAPDLAVFNQLDGNIVVMLNDGSGRFSPGVSIQVVSPEDAALAAADVDGDGHADLVLQSGGQLRVRNGRGDGTFDDGFAAAAAGSRLLIALGDFNGDGRPDAVTIDPDGNLTVMAGTEPAAISTNAADEAAGHRTRFDSVAGSTTFKTAARPDRVVPFAGNFPFFNGSGASGILDSASETWTFNNNQPCGLNNCQPFLNWGSPGVGMLNNRSLIATYGESSPAYGMTISFFGGGTVDANMVAQGNFGGCMGGSTSNGFTSFCMWQSGNPIDFWTGQVTGLNTVTFTSRNPSLEFLSPMTPQYFANVFFDGATPTKFTGQWITSFSSCTYSLSSLSTQVVQGISTGTFQVTTTSGCTWTPSVPSDYASWLQVSPTNQQSGTGTVTYNVAQSNTSSSSRIGYVMIAGITAQLSFAVTQAGIPCQVTGFTSQGQPVANAFLPLVPNNPNNVTATLSPADCQLSPSSVTSTTRNTASDWLTINSVSGNQISYSVSTNPLSVQRAASIIIPAAASNASGSQAAFNVTQVGSAQSNCYFTLSQSGQSFPPTGNNLTGSFAVLSPSGCTWTASSTTPNWLSINSSNNGTVSYTVQPNSSSLPRNGSVLITGQDNSVQNYLVTQAGNTSPVTCSASMVSVLPVALEGRTELLGNMQLTCTGTIVADVVLTLNANVANKLTGGIVASGAELTDAQLGGIAGQLLSHTNLHWPQVTLTANVPLTFTNVRVDASLLPPGTNITGQLSVNSTTVAVTVTGSPTMATVNTTLAFVAGQVYTTTAGGGGQFLPVSYQQVGSPAWTTSTTFRLVLTGVPSTSMVYVPVFDSTGKAAQLYAAGDCSGLGGPAITAATPRTTTIAGVLYYQLPDTATDQVATWQVLTPASTNLTFPLYIIPSPASSNAWANINVVGSYAPVSPSGSAADPAFCTADQAAIAQTTPRYRDFSVPLQFSYLRITPAITVAPSGPGTFSTTVTNLGSQAWTGILTSSIVGGNGPTGNITSTCNTNAGDTQNCKSSGGQTTWYPSIAAGQTATFTGTYQVTSLPQFMALVAGTARTMTSIMNKVSEESSTSAAGGRCTTNCPPVGLLPITVSFVNLPVTSTFGTVTNAFGKSFPVTGYALSDSQHPIVPSSVQVYANSNLLGNATYGMPDPTNVCGYISLGSYDCSFNNGRIGFNFNLDTTGMANGSYNMSASAMDTAPNLGTFPGSGQQVTVNVQNLVVSGTVTGSSGPQNNFTINISGTPASGWTQLGFPSSTTTNSSGAYSVTLPPGNYTLTASQPGFSGPITVSSSVGANLTGQNFTPGNGGGTGGSGTTGCIGVFTSSTNLGCSAMNQGSYQGNLAGSIGVPTTFLGAMTLVGNVPGNDAAGMALYNAGGGGGASVSLDLYNTASNGGIPQAKIKAVDDGNYSDNLTFWTKSPGGPTNQVFERVRIASNGNVGIGTNNPTQGPLQMASGAHVTAGGVWTNSSDRNVKENFAPVSPAAILQKIDALPLLEWNYRNEDASVRHLGPVAQDFFSIFGLGNSTTSISTIDPSGIALVGIQGLDQKSQGRAAKLAELKQQLELRTEELRSLQERLAHLESLVEQTTSGADRR